MSRYKKTDDEFEEAPQIYDDDVDMEEFFDSMIERSTRRRRRRKFSARQHLDDLEEKRWLRQHLDDWDTESIH